MMGGKMRWEVLKELLKNHQCKIGAEIGVGTGHTSQYLLKNIHYLKVYVIDPYLPYEDTFWGKVRSINEAEEEAKKRLGNFIKKGRCIWIKQTSVAAAEKIEDKSLDFVFLDASHNYESVAKDIRTWYPKVKDEGLLCGHDYDHNDFPGVKKAIDEFAYRYNKKILLESDYVWYCVK